MKITERAVGDVTVLDLQGRLVLDDGCDLFRDTVNRLVQIGRRKLLVNLDQVTYVDSAGLGMLVSKYLTVVKRGGQLKLCNLRRRSYRVLNITRLLTVFERFESEAEALKTFDDEAPVS
jgi:anti-anti-sigma factor